MTAWLLPSLLSSALAGDVQIYDRAVTLIDERYLGIDTLDVSLAFEEAAEAAEDAVPWLIVDVGGGIISLSHGERGPFASLAMEPEGAAGPAIQSLPAALGRLEDSILAAGYPLPADVDLPVELLRGVSRAMDRHSVVLSRDRLTKFDERISGKLSGIGARVGAESGRLQITQVFPGGPADLGGVFEGDWLLRIDGHTAVGLSPSQAVERIRGPEDSQVLIAIGRLGREGAEEEIELVLTRAEVLIPNVSWTLRGSGVGVITVDHFSEQTTVLMRQALHDFERGPVPLAGVVLDLRGNAGGSMIQSCRAADLFVGSGTVIRTEGRGGRRVENLLREYRAHPEEVEPDVPVVVLIDRGSASASEILAGALALLDRAVLIGRESHGKGTVQKLFTLRSGEHGERVRFKMTVAEYRLPGGVPIVAGEGLLPDVVLRPAVLDQGGVWMPRVDPGVLYLDEREGWRDPPGELDRGDFQMDFAERVLLDADGAHRMDVLAALERVQESVAAEEQGRIREALAARGLDWRAADEDAGLPLVNVDVTVVEPARSGDRVEVRAQVQNNGVAPLYQLRVRLASADRSLPWHGLVLPIGFLPPGESAMGSAMVLLPQIGASREDEVAVSVLSDRRSAVAVEPVVLELIGRPEPRLVAHARLVPDGDLPRVEVTLENRSSVHLTQLEVKLARRSEGPVELLESTSRVALIPSGGSERADFAVATTALEGTGELGLRVSAEGWGRLIDLPFVLPMNGQDVPLVPPVVAADLPVAIDPGPFKMHIRARDESAVASVTVWVDRQKLAWRGGSGKRLDFDVVAELREGRQTVVVEAEDDQGLTTRREYTVRGRRLPDSEDGYTSGGGELPEHEQAAAPGAKPDLPEAE